MAKARTTYADLLKLAESYGVKDNALFISAVNQYCVQQKVIENINKALEEEDELVTKKEYVKGRENIYANPLVRELPKHADSANKTLAIMLDIITKLGREQKAPSKLGAMIDE